MFSVSTELIDRMREEDPHIKVCWGDLKKKTSIIKGSSFAFSILLC